MKGFSILSHEKKNRPDTFHEITITLPEIEQLAPENLKDSLNPGCLNKDPYEWSIIIKLCRMSSPIYPKQLGIFSLLILNHILPGMMKRGNFYDQNGGFNNNRFGPQRFSVGYKL